MKKMNKRKARKTRKLIFGIGITSIILIVSTYAWFIGLSAVSVNEFTIDVKSSDGLTLSLDGNTFTNTISISKDAVTTDLETTYNSNTNHWAGDDGLVPISSVGVLDKSISRLQLYSKTSILSLKGGYKLRSDLLDNHTVDDETGLVDEQDGYVVFDLFIKNASGTGYTTEFNAADDEGIYLSTDSIARMVAAGSASEGGSGSEGGDGIENSVRVAFMQIGRMSSSSSSSDVQSIKCFDGTQEDEEDYQYGTSLCNVGTTSNTTGKGITWNIWEPNDTKHNTASVNHFNNICKKRTGTDTYDGACTPITIGGEDSGLADNYAVKTYAVNSQITSTDNVNIYDGLNSYASISNKLTEMTYFTDTMKNAEDKTEIFYLASNSITKVRVYIWLEGQDVDNYDLGTIGKKVSIAFGFTKDKYISEEE